MKEYGPVADDVSRASRVDYSKLGTAKSNEVRELSVDELRLNNVLQLQLARNLSADWFGWLTNAENARTFRTAFNAVREEWLKGEPEKWFEMVRECARLEDQETEALSGVKEDILEKMKEEA